jgi:hypothetical protein
MRLIVLFFALLTTLNLHAQRICGAHDLHQELLNTDPDYARRHKEIEDYTARFLRDFKPEIMNTGEIIIPVVFHIIWNTAAQNLSNQRILEQLETLNKDFNATNSDTSLIPGPFKPLKGSFNVRFVLANRDPNGNPTTGIVRRQTTRTSFTASSVTTPTAQPMKFTAQGGSDAWDTRSYFNIWVCNLSGGVLGYATFPASAGTAYDGIVLGTQYTGSTGASAPFNKGRTGTHEAGHYFNLRHIWGDANNCTATDFVDDTPNQRAATSGCPTSFPRTDACSGNSPGIMYMNYMDYTDDACMYMFTLGQAARMLAALNGPRASLLTSKGYVEELRNDMSTDAILLPTSTICENSVTPVIRFKNKGANDVTKFTAAYRIGTGTFVSQEWTGTLKPDSSVSVSFSTINLNNGIYNLTALCTNPNDTTDARKDNDTLRFSFRIGFIPSGTISGKTVVCEGESTTLNAIGCTTGTFNIADYAAQSYVVEEFDTLGTPYEENPISVQIVADVRPNTLAIFNFGDWPTPLPAFLTFNPDPANPAVQVLETRNGFVQGSDTLLWTGSGTYDPCTKAFTVNYGFKNPRTGAILVPAVQKFTPQQLYGLTYLWNTGSTEPVITVTPGTSTEYTVTLTNGSCTQVRNITVNVTSKVNPTFNPILPICSGATAPVLQTTSTNGISGTWTPPVVSNTESGTYNFTPGPGICANAGSLEIIVNESPVAAVSSAAPICAGESAELTATGGVSYAWSTGDSTATIQVNPSATTNYTVTVTGSNSCTASASTTVTVKPIPSAPSAGSNSPITEGNSINLTASPVSGATYTWTGPGGFTSSSQNPVIPNATPANSGIYTVFVTVNGCVSETASVAVVVNVSNSISESVMNGLALAPNPFRYNSTLSFNLFESKRLTISITDLSGRELQKQIFNAEPGVNVLQVGNDLSAGTYMLSIDTGTEMQTLKMVAVK